MPIVVEHQPSAAAIAGAAHLAGLGDYARWQSEQQLRRDQMAMQAALQQRGLQANLLSQLMGHQSRLVGAQQGHVLDLARMKFGAELERERIDKAAAIDEKRREADREFIRERDWVAVGRAEEAEKRRRLWAAEEMEMAMARDAMREQRERVEAGLRSGTLRYTQQQKERRGQLQADLADLNTRDDLDALQKMQARADILKELEAIQPVEVPLDEQPKGFQERNGLRVGDILDETGNPTGLIGVEQPDGTIDIRPKPPTVEEKQAEAHAKALTAAQKQIADAEKSVADMEKAMLEQMRTMDDLFIQNPEEGAKRKQEIFARYQQRIARAEQRVQRAYQEFDKLSGAMDEPVETIEEGSVPEQEASAQQLGDLIQAGDNVFQLPADFDPNYVGPREARILGVEPDTSGPDGRVAGASQAGQPANQQPKAAQPPKGFAYPFNNPALRPLPVVNTPQEAAQLPSGAQFLIPGDPNPRTRL